MHYLAYKLSFSNFNSTKHLLEQFLSALNDAKIAFQGFPVYKESRWKSVKVVEKVKMENCEGRRKSQGGNRNKQEFCYY